MPLNLKKFVEKLPGNSSYLYQIFSFTTVCSSNLMNLQHLLYFKSPKQEKRNIRRMIKKRERRSKRRDDVAIWGKKKAAVIIHSHTHPYVVYTGNNSWCDFFYGQYGLCTKLVKTNDRLAKVEALLASSVRIAILNYHFWWDFCNVCCCYLLLLILIAAILLLHTKPSQKFRKSRQLMIKQFQIRT